MSVFSIVPCIPFVSLFSTSFRFSSVKDILKQPFCSALSPTCHNDVPYGTLMHTFQGWSGLKIYSRNGISNLLPWPSRSKKGEIPLLRSNSYILSICSSIAASNSDVMLPLLEQQQKQGTNVCFRGCCAVLCSH
jgi:hypothetical protein